MATIKFCKNNFVNGKDEIAKKLKENYENINVIVGDCLGYCSDCALTPYALVNDEVVQGGTTEELYGNIVKKL